jgi:hypothetical protein
MSSTIPQLARQNEEGKNEPQFHSLMEARLTSIDNDGHCPICMHIFQHNTIAITECQHIMCRSCIHRWAEVRSTCSQSKGHIIGACPMCKTSYESYYICDEYSNTGVKRLINADRKRLERLFTTTSQDGGTIREDPNPDIPAAYLGTMGYYQPTNLEPGHFSPFEKSLLTEGFSVSFGVASMAAEAAMGLLGRLLKGALCGRRPVRRGSGARLTEQMHYSKSAQTFASANPALMGGTRQR